MQEARGGARRALGALLPVRHRMLAWVVVAAAVGVALPRGSALLNPLVPVFLAGQVLGVALNITPGEMRAAVRDAHLVGLALLVQWTILPGLGLLLRQLAPTPLLASGIMICAASPAEITSGLMATIAGGDTAVAAACMSGSLALSIVLTPFWLAVGLGPAAKISPTSLALELLLSVLLPLAAGVALRSRFPEIARWRHQLLDLSAFCLVLVVLAGTASARGVLTSGAILTMLPFVAALLAGGGIAGWGFGRVLRLRRRQAVALAFPIGIREFGVAIAVAVAVAPRSSAVGGVYGIVMVAAAGTLASRMGRRGVGPPDALDVTSSLTGGNSPQGGSREFGPRRTLRSSAHRAAMSRRTSPAFALPGRSWPRPGVAHRLCGIVMEVDD